MPVRSDASDAPTLVRYALDGEWTARELIERRRELVRAGHLTQESAVLFDLRRATAIPELGDLRPAVHTSEAIWAACRAFLVTTQVQYDGARQLQALLGPQSVINEIFHEESDALAWLASMAGRTRAIKV